ncbi:bifunctional 4-hydroxy-2-oxoglutarate aldolase/2-dehydro-3-deoxy-phosphogluconate aldolase [Collinsella tanakaei]|uniref:bifunctional 4-hydroxy-2-oxoglutarate aldolase/2-dehydro-3-deoxy-phosphogluconate aldolase n=1 Tax=Collinsella tanakaei TaxID=626935 RepID=UPI001F16ACF5|nr:bifunctional 4-hydroxy-2-oxoglutarate aldolase/2-dehydro-3-deoxy-phosphogluconate aldolase [Collinsella tanakaei]MCF2622357.1 bifunctional 4-hydroxy-2-oxoglutarate aldolase/2-dehydro-3-deoxy-phosphogluconate aldolase [Collinsella tanakaei]MDM8302523.1 bifunctional 4-hydroxy-2-oxoglutarate aldolase/2-dehydro-3-deoxy-phosphogluconate aldolase [Collinsella tanakaei]
MSTEYMKSNGFYEQVEKTGVVPVVVLEKVEDAVPMANALVAGGLPAAEVTFRTAAAADCIHEMAEKCPDILVGAGTVVNLEQCKKAVDAGAKFIVSPGYDMAIIDWCLEHEVNLIPGGVTPAELTTLINLGFDITKFFPANLYGGLKAIEALAAVFVGHRFMPTGGVSPDNVRDFLGSKAILAAGGTWMVKPNLFADGDFSRVEALTADAAAAVREIRG